MHDFFKNSGVEFGKKSSWIQCSNCGCAKYYGFWWLGGYKSKIEPPCEICPINEDWRKKSELVINATNATNDTILDLYVISYKITCDFRGQYDTVNLQQYF